MTGPARVRAGTALRAAATAFLILGAVTMSAHADQPPAPTATTGSRGRAPADPILAIEGSPNAWFLSDTPAGCYAISPNDKPSSRIAIGRHPTLGSGMLVINLGLAVQRSNSHEPVVVMIDGEPHPEVGQMVANMLLFIPLAPAEIESELQELQDSGVIWIQVRQAWLGHAGHTMRDAVAEYGKACGSKQ
jgi:hypothetical protein